MVTAVHKFDFVHVRNKTTKFGDLGRAGHAVERTEVFDVIRVCMMTRKMMMMMMMMMSMYA